MAHFLWECYQDISTMIGDKENANNNKGYAHIKFTGAHAGKNNLEN